jgi:hypothetical protein
MLQLGGVWFMHLNAESHRYLRPGIPDLIVCIQGRFYGIELKVPKGRVRPEQKQEMESIEASGGQTHVLRSTQELYDLLDAEGVWVRFLDHNIA